jgi:thiamine biosynthesis lipoprotein
VYTAQSQVLENAEQAFARARASNRAVLLIFSGSDWCQPCIRFHKTILADSSFLQFAGRELVMLKADFPQRKKLSKEVITQNEALAEQFNPSGEFPRLLLLKPDKSVLSVIAFRDQSAKAFVTQLHQSLDNAHMLKEYTTRAKLMGSAFEFIVAVDDSRHNGEALLQECIAEVQRLEAMLTEFDQKSETSLINRSAGIQPVEVSLETYQLIERSIHISALTGGAFDITSGILKKLYNFKGQEFTFPATSVIQQTLKLTGYNKIQLTPPHNVYLPVQGMHIGFGAIGKGYAADRVKNRLRSKGVESGVINASGDLTAWGMRADGQPWKTGIADPDGPEKIIVWLPVNGLSVATSGNYIQFFEHKGKRYSHNINPLTGQPVTGIKSVTVISPGAELSDALATAVTVMGVKNGISFINALPETHCIIIDDHNRIHRSKNIDVGYAV